MTATTDRIKAASKRRKEAADLLSKVKGNNRLTMRSEKGGVTTIAQSSIKRLYTIGRQTAGGTLKATSGAAREARAWIESALEDGAEIIFGEE